MRTSGKVSHVDTREPVEALLPPDALPQEKLPTAECSLSLAGPSGLSALSRSGELTRGFSFGTVIMENVFLKAACSPLWGLLTCLLKGSYSRVPLAFLAPEEMSASFATQKASPTANPRELDLSGLKVIIARGLVEETVSQGQPESSNWPRTILLLS